MRRAVAGGPLVGIGIDRYGARTRAENDDVTSNRPRTRNGRSRTTAIFAAVVSAIPTQRAATIAFVSVSLWSERSQLSSDSTSGRPMQMVTTATASARRTLTLAV